MNGNSVGDAAAWRIEIEYVHSARDINHPLNIRVTLFGDSTLLLTGEGNRMEISYVSQKLLANSRGERNEFSKLLAWRHIVERLAGPAVEAPLDSKQVFR